MIKLIPNKKRLFRGETVRIALIYGVETTCTSNMLRNFVRPQNKTCKNDVILREMCIVKIK